MTAAASTRRQRVLLLTLPSFNRVHGTGITLSNLFEGWPRDRIAMIHADSVPPTYEICESYFPLGGSEVRRLGPLFGMRPPRLIDGATTTSAAGRGVRGIVKQALFGNMLPDNGRLTPALEQWIRRFRPEVLYTILGSNSMMDLAVAIRDKFATKVVLHFMDDWPAVVYRGGALSFVGRRRSEALLENLVDGSNLRFGISPSMCRMYEQRFRRSFTPFMNAVDASRYDGAARQVLQMTQAKGGKEILYVGSILPHAQLGALMDCCRAVAHLREHGLRLTIRTSAEYLARYRDMLTIAPNITVAESPPDGPEFVDLVKSASVLLLPVSFDRETVSFIRHSLPTKVPAYLASGTPILAYGPPNVAQIEYARDEQWALVVSEPNEATLVEAMRRIVEDEPLRARLRARALEVARERHTLATVRDQFQSAIAGLD